VVAYEAGREGLWLARWLQARDVEVYVIHPTSIAVSREHRRAKTDRLDTELLMRAFLGWLRGEKHHCSMVAIPTIQEEDARRQIASGRIRSPNRTVISITERLDFCGMTCRSPLVGFVLRKSCHRTA
jgi:transposase